MGKKLGFSSYPLHKHKNMQLLEKCCSRLWEIIMIQIVGMLALQNKEERNFLEPPMFLEVCYGMGVFT